jgi:hypothetical protein
MTAPPHAQSPTDSVERALERARDHARVAVSESIRSLRAFVEAVALAFGDDLEGTTASVFTSITKQLDDLETVLSGGNSEDWRPLFQMVMDAVDAEVQRWEARSKTDPNARTVLRAYLSFRELLWEVGARGQKSGTSRECQARAAARPGKQ